MEGKIPQAKPEVPPNGDGNVPNRVQPAVDPHLVYFRVSRNVSGESDCKKLTSYLCDCSGMTQNAHSTTQCGRSG